MTIPGFYKQKDNCSNASIPKGIENNNNNYNNKKKL
jgi:hypothetical protein